MSEMQEKPMLTDVFVSGVKRGWGIATGSTLPNVPMIASSTRKTMGGSAKASVTRMSECCHTASMSIGG